jgi:uncharacterized protein (TIGR03790 family)
MKLKFLLVAAALGSLVPGPVLAAGKTGAQVVVVYNSRLPESKDIAEHYAAMRSVPKDQVFAFDLPVEEEMSRADFQQKLQNPLARALAKGKLWRIGERSFLTATNQPPTRERVVVESKIRYAVLCYGVPLRIQADPGVKEEGSEKLRPELQRNEAAVDNELALLPLLERKLPIGGPLNNPVYGTTNLTALHPTNGVLLVARLDGPTPQIARALVDKAMQAETNGLWGNTYFDLRNITEEGYRIGDTWIRNASEIARRLGFETMVDENPGTFPQSYPMDHIAYYVGWYDDHVSGPFTLPEVEFMPGAFAYHLHSYSAAAVRNPNVHWSGPLLAKGVTATMGSVYEPYLAGTPDLGIFTGRFLYYGFTFGEAAYASQPVLSWMTTIVGDPLYSPYSRTPEQLHEQFVRTGNPLLEWYYARLSNINLSSGKPLPTGIAVLENLELTKKSALLSEKLANLYAAVGKPSSALATYGRALDLNPSPQQRLRLLMTRGGKLAENGQDTEALADYENILKLYPNYSDKLGLYRKMLPLVTKLGLKPQQENYASEIERLTAKK